MKTLKKIALAIDAFLEAITLIGLLSMILIVMAQVFTRKMFDYVFHGSEEITMLLMVWFSFLGIAFGFREQLHLGVDSFTNKLPASFNRVLTKVIEVCVFAFGYYLVHYGWSFTKIMHESRLPATDLPNSLLYAVMPITGVLVCIYSALQLCGIDTRRHRREGGHE